jgi:hypothetical protein
MSLIPWRRVGEPDGETIFDSSMVKLARKGNLRPVEKCV